MKKYLFGLLTGLVIAGSIGVIAATYNAKQISYTPSDNTWNVNTVKGALDDIKKNGTSKKICTKLDGESLAVGSKYECDPGDGTKRNFYVLTVRNDGVDLIMDRNISQGTMTWNNAMKYIENNNLETSWKYVAKVDLPGAQDIANAVGYSSWKAVDSSNLRWCFASHKEDLQSEPFCNTSEAQAYNFLYDYTRACNGCSHSLSNVDGQPYGYWTRDRAESSTAWKVAMQGNFSASSISLSTFSGVRPVITISKSNLSN